MKHRENPPRPRPNRRQWTSLPRTEDRECIVRILWVPSIFYRRYGRCTIYSHQVWQKCPPGTSFCGKQTRSILFCYNPEEWWLEGYFPIGKVAFQGRTVKLRGGTRKFHNYVWDLQPRSFHRLVQVPSRLDLSHVLAQALSIFSSNAIGNHTVITMGLLGCRVGPIVAMLSMVFVSLLVTAATTSATSCDTVQLLQQAMVHQELNLYERPPANRSRSKMKLFFLCEVGGANKVQGLFWLVFLEEVVFGWFKTKYEVKVVDAHVMKLLWHIHMSKPYLTHSNFMPRSSQQLTQRIKRQWIIVIVRRKTFFFEDSSCTLKGEGKMQLLYRVWIG